ncbi:MAG: trypsin-like serine protease [Nitrosomonas sp.]|nr:trypsin-like serine protease [Nitrosomonas sp.]
MKKRYQTLILTGLFWSLTIQAGTDYSTENASADEFWTADRLRNAKPLPLPRARIDESMLQSVFEPYAYDYEERVSVSGNPPVISIKPNKTKLFEPIESELQHDSENKALSDDQKAKPYDYGAYTSDHGIRIKGNAYFTSSRVGFDAKKVDTQKSWPFSATGKLYFVANRSKGECTASVIRRNIVLTAGHCVYDPVKKQYSKEIRFVPAFHNGTDPYGTWRVDGEPIVTESWRKGKGTVPNRGDYALLVMKPDNKGRIIGDVTGYYGYVTYGLDPNHVTMLGYPGNFDGALWMHRVDAQSHYREIIGNTVIYGSDMGGGSSGGPWLENFGLKSNHQSQNMNYVVGVTSYGPIAEDEEDPDFDPNNNKHLGSSILDAQFTDILKKACARNKRNC